MDKFALKPLIVKQFLIALFFFCSLQIYAQVGAPFLPRLPGESMKIKGDLVLLSNNILNADDPNTPYHGNKNNGNFSVNFIDIDGDPTTFSSSSADLNLPTTGCTKIAYAGLYWGGTYPYNVGHPTTSNGTPQDSNRDRPYKNVKIKVPGGNYVTITPTSPSQFSYESIYDIGGSADGFHKPYVNYADITSLVTGLANPNGTYTVADVVGTTLKKKGGSLAGWTIVIIYENQNETAKYISTFDGFAAISSSISNVTFGYSGFKTIPNGLVKARLGVSAMEGDRGVTGPQIAIKASSESSFTTLTTGNLNPLDNFFNSTITVDNQHVTTRNPNSSNTLGWDTDIFNLDNTLNSVLPNDETALEVRIRLTGGGDVAFLFLNTLTVDIVEPEVQIIMEAQDLLGNPIGNGDVALGGGVKYGIEFQNIGNDNAKDLVIIDDLPKNVAFSGTGITVSDSDITWTYDAANHQLRFEVANRLVREGGAKYQISITVETSSSCSDFLDRCANVIKNQTSASYRGKENPTLITNALSSPGFDPCGAPKEGKTEFIVALSSCEFKRNETLCGSNLLLEAGIGFDSYIWTNSVGTEIGNTQSITVNAPGVYNVSVAGDPLCPGYTEEITVSLFGGNPPNPVTAFADDIATCPNDGSKLPKIFLCGAADSRTIETNVGNTTTVEWQKIDNASCSNSLEDRCANRDNSCWTAFSTAKTLAIADEGKYRIKISTGNGCFAFHYFNVYKTAVNPTIVTKDIICGTPGSITIANVPTNYEFSLDGSNYSTTNPIPITTEDNYSVYIRQIGADPDTCIFIESAPVLKKELEVDLQLSHILCKDEKGSIRIQANFVNPQYYYVLKQAGSLLGTSGPDANNDYTFSNLNAGLYSIEVTTDDGCSEILTNVEIEDHGDLEVVATVQNHITCVDGLISAPATGGDNSSYNYAIYSIDGTIVFDVANPDIAQIQASSDFNISTAGAYTIIVIDANNCTNISNEVTVLQDTPPDFTLSATDVICFGESFGSITVNLTNSYGGVLTYSIDGTNFQNSTTLNNLVPGDYTVTVRKIKDGITCDFTDTATISSPGFPLKASAAVVELADCSVDNKATVSVSNPSGGVLPYSYSFDGGVSYSSSSIEKLASGSYNIIIKDAGGCTHIMPVTIDPPLVTPTITADVSYDCAGDGIATITVSNPGYDYNYSLDGATAINSPVFNNVGAGPHTITIGYQNSTPPSPSILFLEDFGAGANIASDFMSGYCYEDLDAVSSCGTGSPSLINDGEYSITHNIGGLFGTAWRNPNDHTNPSSTDGRFLAINVNNTPSLIFRREITVFPNRPIEVSLAAFNLVRFNKDIVKPNLKIELLNSSNVSLQTESTGEIPENNDIDDWHVYTVNLNPGSNTSVVIEISTLAFGGGGNDVAIDDLKATQIPLSCDATKDVNFTIATGKEFTANTTAISDIQCNGASDGTLTFEVHNFNAVTGYEYSLNGAAFITSTASTTTLTGIGTTAISLIVRDVTNTTCSITLNETINEPAILSATAAITTPISCSSGATITTSTTGGIPTYQYQLESSLGAVTTIVTAYQTSNIFTDIPENTGLETYAIRVKDSKECETVTAAFTIVPALDILFNTIVTPCYSGASDGSIQVDVTGGNGDYTFSINGPSGPWIVPTPVSSTTHTFGNLSAGTYTIDVHDKLGCTGTQQIVTINPLLTATVLPTDVSCNDGEIAITAVGGDANYVYAYKKRAVPATPETVIAADFGTNSSLTIITADAGTYDVFVRDHGGGADFCEFTRTITINAAPELTINSIANAPRCFGENGDIQLSITAGDGPFDIALTDLDHAGANNTTITATPTITHSFNNLPSGDYTIAVTDSYGCIKNSATITIIDPELLDATLAPKHPATCGDPDPLENGFMFTAYPDYTAAGLTIQFSNDGGTTWVTPGTLGATYEFTGFLPGTTVDPAMRTIDGGGAQQCIKIFDPYEIPFPLRSLFPIANPEVDCNNGMVVRVDQYGGTGPYEFSYDLVNWTPANTTTTPPSATYNNLIPGRDYTFYLKDLSDNCIVQNDVNIYATYTLDMLISATAEPTCAGGNTGEITFEITDADGSHEDLIRWELYDEATDALVQSSPTNIDYSFGAVLVTVSNLAAGKYYLKAIQVDATSTDTCIGGSKDIVISQGTAITGTPALVSGITCDTPGFINVPDITGGWGSFTYTISSTNFTADIVSTDSSVEIPYANLVNTSLTTFIASVTVVDQYGCTPLPINLGDVTVTIAQPGAIDNVAISNCSAPYSITVTPTPGPDYVYSIDNGVTFLDNNGLFNDVAIGTHNVLIKDKLTGCTVAHGTPITIHPTFEATALPTKLLECSDTAKITINVSNGAGDYAFEVAGDITIARTNFPGTQLVLDIANAGNYIIKVYDNNRPGCPEISIPVEIKAAVIPSITVDNFTDVSCIAASDGTITVSTTDEGYGPYTFTIIATDGVPLGTVIVPVTTTSNSATFTGLSPAVIGHTIQVNATNSCINTIDQIIDQPDAINLPALVATDFACSIGNTVNQINVSIDDTAIIGGSGTYVNYIFSYDNGPTNIATQNGTSTSFIVTDTSGGIVTVEVYDDKGCMQTTSVPIAPYDELQSVTTTITTPISCTNTGENITIDVVSTNNDTGKFEYSDDNGTSWVTSPIFNNLAIGGHSFLVKHIDTGCLFPVSHNVSDPNTFSITITNVSDLKCVGENGAITISASDPTYTGTYSYELFDAATDLSIGILGSVSAANIDVPAGSYYAKVVQDANPLCDQSSGFQILNPPSGALTLTAKEDFPVTCTNDKGVLLAEATGGWGILTYEFVNKDSGAILQAYSSVSSLSSLAAANYTINVKDEKGCIVSEDIELQATPVLTATAALSNGTLLCPEDETATITVTAGGGEGTYSYILSKDGVSSISQNSNTFNNLGAGSYFIQVTDGWGCDVTTTPNITIILPSTVVIDATVTKELGCITLAEITVSATGGTGQYFFSDDGTTFTTVAAANHVFSKPADAAGYQFYAKDQNDCISEVSSQLVISPITPLVIDINESLAKINCFGENTAIISAAVMGGLGDYQYELVDGTGTNIQGPQTDPTFAHLPSGTYKINVTSKDCSLSSDVIIITDPDPIVYSDPEIIQVSCFGANDGSIKLNVTGGTGVIKYSISPNLTQFDIKSEFKDLEPGDYDVVIIDENGCLPIFRTFTITEPAQIQGEFINVQQELCAGDLDGRFEIIITGGTAPYATSLNTTDNSAFVADKTIYTGLEGGKTYDVFIKDANNCITSATMMLDPSVDLSADIIIDYQCQEDTSILANTVTIGIASEFANDVIYVLDGDITTEQLEPVYQNLSSGEHTLTITHANGCINDQVKFTIQETPPPLTLILTESNINTITATASGGGDGYLYSFEGASYTTENVFMIRATDTYTIQVKDSYGCITSAELYIEFIDVEFPMYFSPNGDGKNDIWKPNNLEAYPNVGIKIFDRYGRNIKSFGKDGSWDGLFKNTTLPTGDYWYVIKLNREDDSREFMGHFTLIR